MSDPKYIDAEAFKRRILSYGTVHEGDRIPIPFYKHYFAEAYVAMLRWVREEVDDTPYAEVVPARRGHWERRGYHLHCSCCDWSADLATPHCPGCGAYLGGDV